MTDPTPQAELKAILRERYTPEPVPPCRVCGGELSIQRVGGGEATIWGCSPLEDDPDNPGQLRLKADRGRAENHYSQSRWTQYRSGDSDVIKLLDALEAPHPTPASDAVERVAMAIAPFMVRGLEGCSAAYDYPQLPAKEKARIDAAATAALAAQSGWRDIAEAPKDGTRFLAAGGGLEQVETCSYSDKVGCWCCESCTLDDTDTEPQGYNRPLLWQPLPEPPALNEQQELK